MKSMKLTSTLVLLTLFHSSFALSKDCYMGRGLNFSFDGNKVSGKVSSGNTASPFSFEDKTGAATFLMVSGHIIKSNVDPSTQELKEEIVITKEEHALLSKAADQIEKSFRASLKEMEKKDASSLPEKEKALFEGLKKKWTHALSRLKDARTLLAKGPGKFSEDEIIGSFGILNNIISDDKFPEVYEFSEKGFESGTVCEEEAAERKMPLCKAKGNNCMDAKSSNLALSYDYLCGAWSDVGRIDVSSLPCYTLESGSGGKSDSASGSAASQR